MPTIAVYVEAGSKRVFAGALDWPGWSRSAKTELDALDTLVEYAPRYRRAIGNIASALPVTKISLKTAERLDGNATTDFGAPGVVPRYDEAPLRKGELDRLIAIQRASWLAFDRAARSAEGVALRKGPRGGGRDVARMIDHVFDADKAYLAHIGGLLAKGGEMKALRGAFVDALAALAAGEPPAKPRRSGRSWPPRYAIRRAAWHALDHAWEIEDRREDRT